jgi:uncharacterized membrane-anchored protein
MIKLRIIIFTLVALTQISVPASMIWKRQRTLREGRLWKFRTAPVDPVDAMRGRYLALRFEAEEFPRSEGLASEEMSYIRLREDADGFAVIDSVNETTTGADDTIGVESRGYYGGKQHVRFSFDQFWVTEANAPAAEKAYAEHNRREKIDAYATVRILGGDAGIEELYLAGQPLHDYLRAHPP